MSTDINQLYAELHQAEQEALVPKELREKGWIYRDLPGKMTHEYWDLLLSILGEGNYQLFFLSESIKDDWIRGQFLLSPQALENLSAYTKGKN